MHEDATLGAPGVGVAAATRGDKGKAGLSGKVVAGPAAAVGLVGVAAAAAAGSGDDDEQTSQAWGPKTWRGNDGDIDAVVTPPTVTGSGTGATSRLPLLAIRTVLDPQVDDERTSRGPAT